MKGKRAESERESCSCVSCTFQLDEHKICKITFAPTRRFSPPLFTPSRFPQRFMKTKTNKKVKLLESLAHQKNPHAEKIESNRRKTSNQTDPHKIVKILNTQIHPISSMTGFLNLKFCNLIHNSEYILSVS